MNATTTQRKLGGVSSYTRRDGQTVYYAYAQTPEPGTGSYRVCECSRPGGTALYRRVRGGPNKKHLLWGINRLCANVVLKHPPNPAQYKDVAGRMQALINDRFDGIVRVDGLHRDTLFNGCYTIELCSSKLHGSLFDIPWTLTVFDASSVLDVFERRVLPHYAPRHLHWPSGLMSEEHARLAEQRFGFRFQSLLSVSRLTAAEGWIVQVPELEVRGLLFAGTRHEQAISRRFSVRRP